MQITTFFNSCRNMSEKNITHYKQRSLLEWFVQYTPKPNKCITNNTRIAIIIVKYIHPWNASDNSV